MCSTRCPTPAPCMSRLPQPLSPRPRQARIRETQEALNKVTFDNLRKGAHGPGGLAALVAGDGALHGMLLSRGTGGPADMDEDDEDADDAWGAPVAMAGAGAGGLRPSVVPRQRPRFAVLAHGISRSWPWSPPRDHSSHSPPLPSGTQLQALKRMPRRRCVGAVVGMHEGMRQPRQQSCRSAANSDSEIAVGGFDTVG